MQRFLIPRGSFLNYYQTSIRTSINTPARAFKTSRLFSNMPYFNHTSLRIKDPKVSLKFYEDHFDMTLVKKLALDKTNTDIYYIAHEGPKNQYAKKPWFDREGVIGLYHERGSESQDDFKVSNGNAEPYKGFGHLCITVDNVETCCEALEKAGVKFQKRLSDGRMHNIAFALDPDGYWIELLSRVVDYDSGSSKPVETYKDQTKVLNHTMYRIKDPKVSLAFYENVFGMKVHRRMDMEAAKFTNFFLAFGETHKSGNELAAFSREGILELCWNWGTEDDKEFAYNNGRTGVKGFNNIAIVVDDGTDIDSIVEKATANGGKLIEKASEGLLSFNTVIADPDGYYIELLPRKDLPTEIYN